MSATTDPNLHRRLVSVDETGNPVLSTPEYVKTAASQEKPCKDSLYADPVHKVFPCHTKSATWLSAVQMFGNRLTPDGLIREKTGSPEEKRLLAAARVHGIENDVLAIKQAYHRDARPIEDVGDDDDYGIVLEKAAGVKHRHLPIRNEAEAGAAEDYLFRFRDRMSFPVRHRLANQVLTKSAEYGRDLNNPEGVFRIAGRGVSSAETVAELLYKCARMMSVRHKTEATEMAKIAMNVLEGPIPQPETLVKIATLVDTVHRGLRLPASSPTMRPEDTLFCIHPKIAVDIVNNCFQLTTGAMYEKEALDHFPLGRLRDLFGDDFADEVSIGGLSIDREKLASMLGTLPRDEASQFERLSDELGVQPVYSEKTAEYPLSSPDRIRTLAAEHRASAHR